MIYKLADNIVSPLGFTTEENYANVKAGVKGGALRTETFGLPEPFWGSLIDWQAVEACVTKELSPARPLTPFEKIMLLSAHRAVQSAKIDPKSADVLFILSTTKGNVALLGEADGFEKDRVHLWRSAQILAEYFGNPNEVLVASNACISGVAAQLLAIDMMRTKGYRYAVVVGADVLSKFVVSGFQSFKALSPELCKPFDENRVGLNLGEAAATIVLAQVADDTALPSGTSVWRG